MSRKVPKERPRRRNRAPGEAEWEAIKPTLRSLYVKDRRQLKDIAGILEKDYSFHAPLHMYKHRMKKWNMKKNYKLEELAAVADNSAQCFVRAGLQVPKSLDLIVPLRRAKRHFRPLFEDPASQRPANSSNGPERITSVDTAVAKRSNSSRITCPQSIMPVVTLHHSDGLRDFEAILLQVKNCLEYTFLKRLSTKTRVADDSQQRSFQLIHLGLFFSTITDNCRKITSGATHLVATLIDQVCREVEKVLRNEADDLLLSLVASCSCFFALRSNLQGRAYFCLGAISRKILGRAHPVTMILDLAGRSEGFITSGYLILQLMYDTVLRLRGSDSVLASKLESALARSLSDDVNVDFYSASAGWQHALQQELHRFGHNTEDYRLLLFEYGQLHWKHGFNDEAKKTFHDFLVLHDFAGAETDSEWIFAVYLLSCIYEDEGDLQNARNYREQYHCEEARLFGSGNVEAGGNTIGTDEREKLILDATNQLDQLGQEMEQLHLSNGGDGDVAEPEVPWVDKHPAGMESHELPDTQASTESSVAESRSESASSDQQVDQTNFDDEIVKSQHLMALGAEVMPNMHTNEPQSATVWDPLEPVFGEDAVMHHVHEQTLSDDIPVLSMSMEDFARMSSNPLQPDFAFGAVPEIQPDFLLDETLGDGFDFQSFDNAQDQWAVSGYNPMDLDIPAELDDGHDRTQGLDGTTMEFGDFSLPEDFSLSEDFPLAEDLFSSQDWWAEEAQYPGSPDDQQFLELC